MLVSCMTSVQKNFNQLSDIYSMLVQFYYYYCMVGIGEFFLHL